jgi:REP element-mobilizing transposase RayT
MTMTVVDWIDVFTRRSHKDVIVDSLNYCVQHKGLIVYAWSLMSHHLHLLVAAREGHDLSGIIRDFKKFTAKSIIKRIQTEPESRREWLLQHFEFAGRFDKRITKYKFWQEDNHAISIHPSHMAMFKQKLDYIHSNAVTEGIVGHPEDYLYSSATDYAGERGLVTVAIE